MAVSIPTTAPAPAPIPTQVSVSWLAVEPVVKATPRRRWGPPVHRPVSVIVPENRWGMPSKTEALTAGTVKLMA